MNNKDLTIEISILYQDRAFRAKSVLPEAELTVERLDNLMEHLGVSVRITCLKNNIIPYPDWCRDSNLSQDEQSVSTSSVLDKSNGMGIGD